MWKDTGINARQITSSPYATYVVFMNNEVKYVTNMDPENFGKQVFLSLQGTLGRVQNVISAGFDGSLAGLTNTGRLVTTTADASLRTARNLSSQLPWKPS
jgi:hypothetical protein